MVKKIKVIKDIKKIEENDGKIEVKIRGVIEENLDEELFDDPLEDSKKECDICGREFYYGEEYSYLSLLEDDDEKEFCCCSKKCWEEYVLREAERIRFEMSDK